MRSFPALAALAALSVSASAMAGEARDDLPTSTATPPGGTTVVQTAPGAGGVTVVAPTAGGGQVTATGCQTVIVQGNPTLIGPNGGPCPPQYAPYQPYSAAPVYAPVPRYAPDPDRKAALLASTIFFGVGTGVAGIVYLIQWEGNDSYSCASGYSGGSPTYASACRKDPARSRASLMTYGAIITLTPSIPRFVVGDASKGLIYTGLRVASFAVAALVDWGDKSDTKWQGPFLLGFAAPLTLGIIDLATTPHREDLVEKEGVTGFGVVPVAQGGKTNGALVSLQGLF